MIWWGSWLTATWANLYICLAGQRRENSSFKGYLAIMIDRILKNEHDLANCPSGCSENAV